jgi:hypothetical protein
MNMQCLGRVLLILVVIAAVAAIIWYLLSRSEVTADLGAIRSDVQLWDASASQQESVPTGDRRKMHAEDGVNVDTTGRARISAEQCIWEVYRSTSLKVEQLPTQSAQVCVVQLSHGTINNKVQTKAQVKTDWAVVTAVSTRFLVHVDPARDYVWVSVQDGVVEVTARGVTVRLGAREQTWVFRGEAPVPPRPTRRSEAEGLPLPPIETLTAGELREGDVFLPEVAEPPTEPPRLALEQSTNEVIAGECSGQHTLLLGAFLHGSDEARANAARALVRYRWEGSPEMIAEMERVDDHLFEVEIGPFDYCCSETTAEYQVDVLDPSGEVLVTRTGTFLITYCVEPPRLFLEQSTDEVLAGACSGPHTIQIWAYLSGSDEAAANATRALVHYQWEDSGERVDEMERVDDLTFAVELGPFDYCCMQTGAEYWVEVLDAFEQVLVGEAGKFVISFCIE